MDFLRSTRKRILGSKWIASNSVEVPIEVRIFVKTTKQTIVFKLNTFASVGAVKHRIELRAKRFPETNRAQRVWYPVSRQILSYMGKPLCNDLTLDVCNISNNSTLQLEMLPVPGRATACDVLVRILPGNREADLKVTLGLRATIRDVKLLLSKEQGIQCENLYLQSDLLYLDDELQAGDDMTLEACGFPDQALVWMIFPKFSLPSSPCSSRPQRNREMTAATSEDAFSDRRTIPGSGDTEHLEVEEATVQVNCECTTPNSDIAIATVQQAHEDCDRKIPHTLDELNKLQVDSQLQRDPSALSLVCEDTQRFQQELKELNSEFAQQLSLAISERNNVHQQLCELQSEFQRQLSLVLDENSELQRESCQLQKELDTVKIQLGQEKERSLCMICFDRPRDTLVLSCLHLHFCSPCLEKHQEKNSTCPTCRGFISGKLICGVSIS